MEVVLGSDGMSHFLFVRFSRKRSDWPMEMAIGLLWMDVNEQARVSLLQQKLWIYSLHLTRALEDI